MRVLIACEFSGVVRRAFAERGHEAYSCDLLPAEDMETVYHFTGTLQAFLEQNKRDFDLIIGHPPCRFLANSGAKWLYKLGLKKNGRDGQRWANMRAGADFFNLIWRLPCKRIAVENPIPHCYAKERMGEYSQTIQPWKFGHGEIKCTCLWLKNLPQLQPTKIVSGREARVHKMPPGDNRWKERSRTLPGIAAAMAEQWGGL